MCSLCSPGRRGRLIRLSKGSLIQNRSRPLRGSQAQKHTSHMAGLCSTHPWARSPQIWGGAWYLHFLQSSPGSSDEKPGVKTYDVNQGPDEHQCSTQSTAALAASPRGLAPHREAPAFLPSGPAPAPEHSPRFTFLWDTVTRFRRALGPLHGVWPGSHLPGLHCTSGAPVHSPKLPIRTSSHSHPGLKHQPSRMAQVPDYS